MTIKERQLLQLAVSLLRSVPFVMPSGCNRRESGMRAGISRQDRKIFFRAMPEELLLACYHAAWQRLNKQAHVGVQKLQKPSFASFQTSEPNESFCPVENLFYES